MRTPQFPLELKSSSLILQGFFFYIFLQFISSLFPFYFQFISNFQPLHPLFLPKTQNPNKFTILNLTVNHLCEENPSLYSTLDPLYCSSHATSIGGIRFINFVDSGTPYCTRSTRTCYNACYKLGSYSTNILP